jgi:acetyltransferase-like isoleucine patch superfamily enzyme
MIIEHIVKNGFTLWLRSFLRTIYAELSNRHKYLKIGYMSSVSNCVFGIYNTIYDHVVLQNVELGDFTYIANGSIIKFTKFGKYCSIGPDIKCGLGRHPTHTFVSTHPIFFSTLKQAQVTFADNNYFEEYKKIVIGNDVWIGANVIIVDGVEIRDGSIIGANSVVTKNVPPYAIVAGTPAKIVRYRFNEVEIQFLLKYKWWDRDVSWIKENYKIFHDIKYFTEYHGNIEGNSIVSNSSPV